MATNTIEAATPTHEWSELWSRPGWDLAFTNVGGRLRGDEPLDGLSENELRDARRLASQVCIAVNSLGAQLPDDRDIDYWATVCRKLLQRGARPPVSVRLEGVVRGRIGSGLGRADFIAAVNASPAIELPSSYQLHHTWETPFWQAVRQHAPEASAWLLPQAPLEGLLCGKVPKDIARRWVDFLYCPPGRDPLVLEIDGAGHERRADVDKGRDRLLRVAGISVMRATGAESLDPNGSFLTLLRRDTQARRGPAVRREALLAIHGSAAPARFAMAIVEAVARGLLPKGGPWGIEVADDLDLIGDIAGGSLDILRSVSQLWGVGVVPATITVNSRVWHLAGSDVNEGAPLRAVRPALRIRLEPTVPYWAKLPDDIDLPEIVVRRVGVPTKFPWLPQTTNKRRALSRQADVETHLTVLLVDLFGYSAFKVKQLESVQQALSGGDAVVLLPTASGKSLIYQMAGLLTPGTTLVVDPLVSLIDDQERGLVRDGVDRVAALHSARPGGSDARDLALAQVAAGEALFVFLTPERFQSRRFRENLRKVAREQTINLAVIDETHCVSEWGHDFRTSYLRLAGNIRRLCVDRNRQIPPLLALTGTASPGVLRDVLRELEIDGRAPGALQRPEKHDRSNLTYMKLTGPESQWSELVLKAILDVVPKHLGVAVGQLTATCGRQTLSGIVFAPHVNGKHGILAIRDLIVAALGSRGEDLKAEVYSGSSPTGEGDRQAWSLQNADAADAFINGRVPLLVATKAFGMGINKPNIRYTVHAGFPSSIEAYAQEAGRAGRDGEPAICVLTASIAEKSVAESLLNRSLSPEQRRATSRGMRDEQGGDLRRQLFFLGISFPGEVDEVRHATALFDWMLRKGGGPNREVAVFLGARPKDTEDATKQRRAKVDRALYRLAMVGVVDDVTIDGPEATVQFSDYTSDSIDNAYIGYAARVEPGNELAHREAVRAAHETLDERVADHLRAVIELVYRNVVQGRLNALESMYRLAAGPGDNPGWIREEINAYLGQGPAAAILSEAMQPGPVDLPRFIKALNSLPVEDVKELAGATARQMETYPDHPLLWFSRALATARGADAAEADFASAFRHSLARMSSYGVKETEAAKAVQWMASRFRNENGGRRWNWVATILDAWDQTTFPGELLEPIEKDALTLAKTGLVNPRELNAIARRRLRRRSREADLLANQLTDVTSGTQVATDSTSPRG